MAQYIGSTVITSVVAGTSLSGGGTAGAVTLNFDPGTDGITIKDTTASSATEGGNLILASDDGAVMAGGHRLGVIEFSGAEDTSNTISKGATIEGFATTAWNGSQNQSKMMFSCVDGTTNNLILGLNETGGTDKLAWFRGNVIIGGNLSLTGDIDVSQNDAYVNIKNATTSSATEGGEITLLSDDGAAMGSGHRLGVINFKGAEDASETHTVGARIEALADATWSASENGTDLVFYTTDGNATQTEQMRCTASTGVSIPKRKFTPTGTGTNGTITGGDVVYFGGTTSMTAGAIYHYKSDGTWELADADAVATSDGLLAVALGTASDTNGMCLRGMVTIDHDPGAIGDVLFLSTTAGDCSATAPSGSADIVRVIGYQVNHASNGEIWFCPDGTYVELA